MSGNARRRKQRWTRQANVRTRDGVSRRVRTIEVDSVPTCKCEWLPGLGVDSSGCPMHGDGSPV